MTPHWHDISVRLDHNLPTWPGSPGILTALRTSIDRGDDANVTQMELDVHTGTHVDAPAHFFTHGLDVEELGLCPFVGRVIVVDPGPSRELTASVLANTNIPPGTKRVLLRTANSSDPNTYTSPFSERYAALTLDGAEWLAARKLCLVGIDYLSIQRYSDPPNVHKVLLGAGIPILEGLSLARVSPGEYDLVCLPIRLISTEGAPARAILLPPQSVGAE